MQTIAAQMVRARAVLSGAPASIAAAPHNVLDGVHWQLHDLAAEDVAAPPVKAVVWQAIQRIILQASLRPQAQLLQFLLGASLHLLVHGL